MKDMTHPSTVSATAEGEFLRHLARLIAGRHVRQVPAGGPTRKSTCTGLCRPRRSGAAGLKPEPIAEEPCGKSAEIATS